jgi:hypothetical protein
MKVCTKFRLENLEKEATRNVQPQMKDDLREKKCEAVDLIQLAEVRVQQWNFVNIETDIRIP